MSADLSQQCLEGDIRFESQACIICQKSSTTLASMRRMFESKLNLQLQSRKPFL